MRWEMETWRNYFGREFVGIFGAGLEILPLRFTKLKTKKFLLYHETITVQYHCIYSKVLNFNWKHLFRDFIYFPAQNY